MLLFAFFGWAFRGAWQEAKPLLRHADLRDVAISIVILAAYYLLFTVGWQRILRPGGSRSLPRGAAGRDGVGPRQVRAGDGLDSGRTDRGVAAVGIHEAPLILASMVLEAGLSGSPASSSSSSA